jgi:hypothetical protein
MIEPKMQCPAMALTAMGLSGIRHPDAMFGRDNVSPASQARARNEKDPPHPEDTAGWGAAKTRWRFSAPNPRATQQASFPLVNRTEGAQPDREKSLPQSLPRARPRCR